MIALFLASCAQKNETPSGLATFERIRLQAIADAGSEFEKLCYENYDQWMRMAPMREGVKAGDTPCYGCMRGKSHICDETEYKKLLG